MVNNKESGLNSCQVYKGVIFSALAASCFAIEISALKYYAFGTWPFRPMRRHPAWPKPGAWIMPKI